MSITDPNVINRHSEFSENGNYLCKAELSSRLICLWLCQSVPAAIFLSPLARLSAFQIMVVSVRGVFDFVHGRMCLRLQIIPSLLRHPAFQALIVL